MSRLEATTLWRYHATPLDGGRAVGGELAGESAAAVRASLRRVGLRVLEVRPVRGAGARRAPWRGALDRHLRARRAAAKAELFDALATMLGAGLPLLEAIGTLGRAATGTAHSRRAMLARMREALRSGASLAGAMRREPAWFDAADVALVEAGQHAGELASVLRAMAERQARRGELTGRLAGALAYPAAVAVVGLAVAVFLGTRTLPQLVGVLVEAGVEPPTLTRAVMGLGAAVARYWPALLVSVAGLAVGAAALQRWMERREGDPPRLLRRAVPGVFRRVALARTALALAELARAGVPMAEALRILAPTAGGPLAVSLRRRLVDAARRLERGDDLAEALDDEMWFDAEFRQMLRVGTTSGELPDLLERLGERYARAARRAIDRLATLLEPAVILVLAVLVGTVVMAAVLPMLRLQEVLR